MEQDKKISALLGMKQEDMAMLLRVNKSQWAMYEIGKRELPLAAQLQLAAMLTFVKQPDNDSVNSYLDLEGQKEEKKKHVEKLKLVNQHKLLIAKNKLQLTEKKYETALLALRFLLFLKTNDQQIVAEQNLLLTVIQLRAESEIRKNGPHIQAKHKIKLQVLQEEEKILNGMV